MKPTPNELRRRFNYHPASPEQGELYSNIRSAQLEFAMYLVEVCPDNRELALALGALEQVGFNANASIARGPHAEG